MHKSLGEQYVPYAVPCIPEPNQPTEDGGALGHISGVTVLQGWSWSCGSSIVSAVCPRSYLLVRGLALPRRLSPVPTLLPPAIQMRVVTTLSQRAKRKLACFLLDSRTV